MIVYDFNFERIARPPCKANPVLIVHPDAVLAFPITFERFQPVAWRHSQILQRLRTMEHSQFPERDAMDTLWKPFRPLPMKQPLCIATGETLNHASMI